LREVVGRNLRRSAGTTVALLGLMLATSAGTATSAAAATWRVRHVPIGGPALIGDQVSWIAPRRDHGGDLYAARPSHTPRRVQMFPADFTPSSDTTVFYGFSLVGSPTNVVLVRGRGCVGRNPCSGELNLYTGRPAARLGRAESCDSDSLGEIGLSGHVAAVPACDGRLILRDLDGSEPDRILARDVVSAQLAGRYAAWLESHGPSHRLRAVVYDLAAGRRSYVLSHIPWQLLHGNLALQDDGKLAFVFDPNPHDLHVRSIVAWASPQEPYAHRLGLAPRPRYDGIARNRIAFFRDSSDLDSSLVEVGVTDLHGHRKLLTRWAPQATSVDFDGKTVAFVTKRRHRTRIRTRTIG